jgi:hypothetical protein
VRGSGYARVDIRMDMDTRRICVLEVNANCGVTGWPNTSMGSIIEWSSLSGLGQLFDIFLSFAYRRQCNIQRRQTIKRGMARDCHPHLPFTSLLPNQYFFILYALC